MRRPLALFFLEAKREKGPSKLVIPDKMRSKNHLTELSSITHNT